MMRFLSWGCGVQSTTLAAISALGELDPLDAVITADIGWERQATYEIRAWYTDWLRERGLQVEVVSAGNIRKQGAEEHIHIPFWTQDGGPLNRQCTRHFKIMPVRRRIRELLGYHASKPPHPPAGAAELWIGLSLDEWARVEKSRVKFIRHHWPLFKKHMTRQECIDWFAEHNLPIPPKSACICCPYRSASEWLALSPEEWAAACEFDEANRHNPLAVRGSSTTDALYLWQGCEPLRTADLESAAEKERIQFRDAMQIPFLACESGDCWL